MALDFEPPLLPPEPAPPNRLREKIEALGQTALLIFILVQSGFAIWLRPRVLQILGAVDSPARDLHLLGEVLGRLEREAFTAPRLMALRSELETEGVAPYDRPW